MQEQETSKTIFTRISQLILQVIDRFRSKQQSSGPEDDFPLYLSQLSQLHELLKAYQTYHEFPTYEQKSKYIDQSAILQKRASELVLKKYINEKMLVRLYSAIEGLLQEITRFTDAQFNYIYAKMHYFGVHLKKSQYMVTLDPEDISSLDKTHPKWQQIQNAVQYSQLSPVQSTKKAWEFFQNMFYSLASAIETSAQGPLTLKRIIPTIFLSIKLLRNPGLALRMHAHFKQHMTIQKVRCQFDCVDSGLAKILLKVLVVSVKYHKIMYVKPVYPEINQRNTLKWIRGQTEKVIFDEVKTNTSVQKDLFEPGQSKIETYIDSESLLERNGQYKGDQPDDYKVIVYDIHGGGWCTMNPNTHQMYLRQWVKLTGVPVFGVNYKKAPEHPFPSGLNDCWQIYNWLLNESHKHFKIIKNKKIILCGDSAGGNLIFSLVNLLIENNVQLPIYLIGIYPVFATYRSLKFTQSRLDCIEDPLLATELFDLFYSCYLPNPQLDVQKNYLVSPLFTPHWILQKYPPTTVFIGSKDPLKDESLRMALVMKQSGTKTPFKVIVYDGMPHGFANFAAPLIGVKEGREFVLDCAELISGIVASVS